MATADTIKSLRRKRGYQVYQFTFLSDRLDEYEQSSQQNKYDLLFYEEELNNTWNQFTAIQGKLRNLAEEENACVPDIYNQYRDISTRLKQLMKSAQSSTPSKPEGKSNMR
jgi:hypothetical protein